MRIARPRGSNSVVFDVAVETGALFGRKAGSSQWRVEQEEQSPRRSLDVVRLSQLRRICRMKPSVYIETTIPSYLTAWVSRDLVRAAHQQITREWWDHRNGLDLYSSRLVIHEIGRASCRERV